MRRQPEIEISDNQDAASALTANEELAVYLAVYLLVLRHPLLVARQLLTVAQLAPGRLSLGVGIAGRRLPRAGCPRR